MSRRRCEQQPLHVRRVPLLRRLSLCKPRGVRSAVAAVAARQRPEQRAMAVLRRKSAPPSPAPKRAPPSGSTPDMPLIKRATHEDVLHVEAVPRIYETTDGLEILEVHIELVGHSVPRPSPQRLGMQPAMEIKEVLLVGAARATEVSWWDLGPKQQPAFNLAMEKEWAKWVQFEATKDIADDELEALRKRLGHKLQIVSTRWVLTCKGDGTAKARLVVIGCQERQRDIRSDAPTGSKESLMIAVIASAQAGWKTTVLDAASAHLQSDGIERTLLLRLPKHNCPKGVRPGQVVRATGSIYGTRDAGRAWYLYFRAILAE